jgi:hypothetical protein
MIQPHHGHHGKMNPHSPSTPPPTAPGRNAHTTPPGSHAGYPCPLLRPARIPRVRGCCGAAQAGVSDHHSPHESGSGVNEDVRWTVWVRLVAQRSPHLLLDLNFALALGSRTSDLGPNLASSSLTPPSSPRSAAPLELHHYDPWTGQKSMEKASRGAKQAPGGFTYRTITSSRSCSATYP